tara:strand:- start:192 stop:407 length:216 start_codon:yes stop_codon:yes gene_type:complete
VIDPGNGGPREYLRKTDNNVMLQGNWYYPTAVRFGAGRLAELPAACAQAGISNPLLLTDSGLASLSVIAGA